MKKQILFLTFFVAAILAGNNAFGQVDTPYLDAAPASCPVPTALNCGTASALTPTPGELYQYDISVSDQGNTTITWFVTTETDVIATGGNLTAVREAATGGQYVLSAGTTTLAGSNATYNDDTNVGDVIEIAWNYFDPGVTVLLVAYAEDAAGCTDNVEVYRIEPVFNFILEIATLGDGGVVSPVAGSSDIDCAFPVQEAIYDGTNLLMDYGDNYIFYVVTAANWVHSWDPIATAPTSAGGSTIGIVEWAYADEADGAGSVWHSMSDPVLASHYGGATSVGANGECIVLRVNTDHGNVNESIVAEDYTMGIDGVMYDASAASGAEYSNGNLADLDDLGSGCINTNTDEATYVLTPRPDVNAEDPTPFVAKN